MQSQRILIVGTTSDYIDLLRKKYPTKELVFITDSTIREKATEERPEPDEELLCELDRLGGVNNLAATNVTNSHSSTLPQEVINLINKHIQLYGITLKGIACFDCESMALTAKIAASFNMPYPSIEAVMACRDKSKTRELWHAKGVPTPKYKRVNSAAQAVEFFNSVQSVQNINFSLNKLNNENLLDKNKINFLRDKISKITPCVLKPVDSSGSERVFRCSTANECEAAYNLICKPQSSPDIIIETYVEGTEYSCDFIIGGTKDGEIKVLKNIFCSGEDVYKHDVIPIRFTRKIPSPIPVFGTTMAYEIVDISSANIDKSYLISVLEKGAKALGITRAICMVDFIVDVHNKVSLLEMTPRPGGDCLPWLIQKAMNIDILKLNLDFACYSNQSFKKEDFKLKHLPTCYDKHLSTGCDKYLPHFDDKLIGLRIHANQSGVLRSIDTKKVESDSRVREIFIKHKTRHQITLPPENYDSWNLGHIIFKPFEDIPYKDQCMELLSMLKIDIIEPKSEDYNG
ncbi:MAG: ATP-grasp domain-containing protein [Desulfamplus sp.]|nr:ATP-grasp domain-containing protein [Desulfamplus sp.]